MPKGGGKAKATVRGKIKRRPPVKSGANHGYGHGGLLTAKVIKINKSIKEKKS